MTQIKIATDELSRFADTDDPVERRSREKEKTQSTRALRAARITLLLGQS